MQACYKPLQETFLIGPQCREWVLSAERLPQLGPRRFVWVGYSEIRAPYRMVRLQSVHAHVVACFKGRGRTLIHQDWVEWGEGQVLLSPRGALHAFEACGQEPWHLAWIFQDDRRGGPLLEPGRTRLVEADCACFVQTLQMLVREASGELDPATLQALVTLLQTHTQRLAGQVQVDERLARLWQAVEADLARPWDLRSLAHRIHLSEEHLRRLCHRHCHRSPMSQVRDLRMHRAAMLLRASTCKVEEIALQVGFASLYSFSAAFKRWSGVTPLLFRRAKRSPERT